MKHKIISVVAGMLLVCLLPVGAQNRPWQSTSAMQQGSTHRFDIQAVNEANVTYKYLLMTSTSATSSMLTLADCLSESLL